MFKVFIFCMLLTSTILFHWSDAMKKCLKMKLAAVDEEFLNNTFKVITHSECDNCEEGDESLLWQTSHALTPQKSCHEITGVTKNGAPFDIKVQCKYRNPAVLNCEYVSEEHKARGASLISRTDNSNYVAGSTCIFGKENFWWIMSIDGKINETIKQNIIQGFADQGFRTDNIAVEGQSKAFLKTVSFFGKTC